MILDAGPLIAADRNDERFAALINELATRNRVAVTTEAVVGQVWRSPRQAGLARALKAIDVIGEFSPGQSVGVLLALSQTTDVIDADVALLASRLDEPVVTGDAGDFAKLSEHLGITVKPWPPD